MQSLTGRIGEPTEFMEYQTEKVIPGYKPTFVVQRSGNSWCVYYVGQGNDDRMAILRSYETRHEACRVAALMAEMWETSIYDICRHAITSLEKQLNGD